MTENRAVRYRRLAMAESDPGKAHLLQKLADEAKRGILHAPGIEFGKAAMVPKAVDSDSA